MFFFAQKGGDYSREAIILNIAHWESIDSILLHSRF